MSGQFANPGGQVLAGMGVSDQKNGCGSPLPQAKPKPGILAKPGPGKSLDAWTNKKRPGQYKFYWPMHFI